MLYTLFLYQAKTGLMLFKKSFDKGIGEKSELFSSFFSAIQSFVKNLILNDSKENSLEAIDLGKYLVNLTEVSDLNVDIVLISDKSDKKPLKKFISKLILILNSHRELFDNWDGDLSRYDVLEVEIIQLISNNKKLSGRDQDDDKTELMDTILDQLPDLEKDQKQKYIEEKAYLEGLFAKSTTFHRKLEIVSAMEEVCRKLKDRHAMEIVILKKKKVLQDMKNLQEKLLYYIRETKSSISTAVDRQKFVPLHQIDFKEAYINLYSFSSNLKHFGNPEIASKYRQWAMDLIKRPEEKEKMNLGEIIQTVLHMPEELTHYIPDLPQMQ